MSKSEAEKERKVRESWQDTFPRSAKVVVEVDGRKVIEKEGGG